MSPRGHDCVVVHLLADDVDLLERYGVDRSTCTSADAWWRFANDVVLLEVASRSYRDGEEGLYGRREIGDGRVVLSAIVAEPLVSSVVMGRVMDRFVEAFRAGELPPLCALPKLPRRFATLSSTG